MSLEGSLEELGLGEILKIVSLSRKTGVLSLSSKGRDGSVFFSQGQVIRASSSTYQQSLGEVLIQKGVIDLALLRIADRARVDAPQHSARSQIFRILLEDFFRFRHGRFQLIALDVEVCEFLEHERGRGIEL